MQLDSCILENPFFPQMKPEKLFSLAFYQNSGTKDLSHSGEVKRG